MAFLLAAKASFRTGMDQDLAVRQVDEPCGNAHFLSRLHGGVFRGGFQEGVVAMVIAGILGDIFLLVLVEIVDRRRHPGVCIGQDADQVIGILRAFDEDAFRLIGRGGLPELEGTDRGMVPDREEQYLRGKIGRRYLSSPAVL